MSSAATAALSAYGWQGAALTTLTAGHINATYRAQVGGDSFVLQRVSPIFGPEVHVDIEAVTTHLERSGVRTPRLIRTLAGELFTRDDEGAIWRALTFIEGKTLLRASSPRQCAAAGALLARFHAALSTLEHTFQNRRGNVHVTAKHLAKLEATLREQHGHARYAAVAPVAERILTQAQTLPSLATLPERAVHGDPKLSNLLFASDDEALCLVDLDTLNRSNVVVELGDALRSWCNRAAEDDVRSTLDLEYLEASMRGYARGAAGALTPAERDGIIVGIETIALELAARFAADALEESYFGWDRTRFSRASEHQLLRAQAQTALAESVRVQRQRASDLVRQCFAAAALGR